MSIRNLKDGSQKSWLCECYPQDRAGKRVRKCFTTKGDATTYELHLMKEVDDKPWMGSKPDSPPLSDIVDLWYSHYGRTFVNGDVIIQKFHHMVKAMGNPVASTFSSKMYSDFRSKRMSGDLVFVDESRRNRDKPSVSTLNSELARFKVVFTFCCRFTLFCGKCACKRFIR